MHSTFHLDLCKLLASSISKLQGTSPCPPHMPSVNDATNWHQRLIALKGLVSKVIVVVSKDNAPLITQPMAKTMKKLSRCHQHQ